MKVCESKTPPVQGKKNTSFFGKPSGTAFFEKVGQEAPSTFISRAPQLSKEQQADEDKLRKAIPRAISLLHKAKPFMAAGGQEELMDQMMNIFDKITPDHIGTLDAKGGRIKLGKPEKLFFNFKQSGDMSKPFGYDIRFDLSHETEGAADGYFRNTGNYGGIIVIKLIRTKTASTEQIAEVLVHETVHMFSHLQRAVEERVGSAESVQVPGKQAGGLLDAAAFAANKKVFAPHFTAVLNFLNGQPHRNDSFSKIPGSVAEDWSRVLVDETIAYVYQSRLNLAIDKVRTAGKKGPRINIGLSFSPLPFLKSYLTTHWLTDPRDQAAMATPEGTALLDAMSADMKDLDKAVEARVGPDATP